MRPIKFRAYKPHHSFGQEPGMYKVSDIVWYNEPSVDKTQDDERTIIGEVFYKGSTGSDYIEDIVLMQFTGLKDKNGVEIYEGDIVECVEKEMFNKRKNHIKFVSPVFWDVLSWTLRESKSCDTALAVYDNTSPSKRPVTTIKVIGNIYENKDLLT